MLREQLEEAHIKMILEANKSRHPYDFKVPGLVFLDTGLLSIGYVNHSKLESAIVNSEQSQHPFYGQFHITEAISANAFRFNTTAQWMIMPNSVNITYLKQSHVDNSQDRPSPPPLHMMTEYNPEYEIEAILEHQGTSAKTLQFNGKCLGYPVPN